VHNPLRIDHRQRLARFIESLLEEATAPVAPSLRRFMPIYRRHVVLACAIPLREISAALHYAERSISADNLRRAATFMAQSDCSTLYGESPFEALRDAELLAARISSDAPSGGAPAAYARVGATTPRASTRPGVCTPNRRLVTVSVVRRPASCSAGH
jgi:hypothetical protein